MFNKSGKYDDMETQSENKDDNPVRVMWIRIFISIVYIFGWMECAIFLQ